MYSLIAALLLAPKGKSIDRCVVFDHYAPVYRAQFFPGLNMRSVVKCDFHFKTNLPQDRKTKLILRFVESLPWTTPFLDHHEAIAPKVKALLDEFPNHRSYLEDSILRTIYLPSCETLGIITESTIGETLDIRLADAQVEKLKQACEIITSGFLQLAATRKYRMAFSIRFRGVQLLERDSESPVYLGGVVQRNPIKAAFHEQKLESAIAVLSFVLSIILLFFSSPAGHGSSGFSLSEDWSNWVYSIASKLSVAFLVTALVSILKIVLHALDLRKAYPIQWRLPEHI